MRAQMHVTEAEYRHIGPVYAVVRVIDFLFGLLYTLLLIRLVLEFVNAAGSAGFFEFIRKVTAPFFAPFQGLVRTTAFDGHPVVWSLVFAIAAYMVLHAVIRALLRLVARA
jgi:uncharacterized protein YggT (Ycf19 family)